MHVLPQRLAIIPLVAFALASCSDATTSPSEDSGAPVALTPTGALNGQGGNPANPNYKSSEHSVSSLNDGGALTHAFDMTGMGSFTTVDFEYTADWTATFVCINHGNNAVQGAPFDITGTAANSGSQAPRNGRLRASISLEVGPGSCQGPGNNPHQAQLLDVEWSDIKFCWGQAVANLQGPVPNGVGSATTLGAGESAGGLPTGGSQAGSTGIFASPCAPA